MSRRIGLLGVAVLVVGSLVAASPVSATYPGQNGKIAFASRRSGNDDIYVMDADGSGVTQLTNNPARDRAPAWSADGKRIVFVRTIGGNDDIWVMNADGSDQKQLTNDPGTDSSPHFSPDGELITFTSTRVGGSEIFVMDDDGTDQTRLTFNASSFGSHWSPDGKTIVFSSTVSGNTDIWVMRANGSDQKNLTNAPGEDISADYAPDGEEIVFASNRTGGKYDVFVMHDDGSGQTNRTNNPGFDDFGGHFSPDGERMVFLSDRTGNNDVFVMNADGSDQTDITNNAAEDFGSDWQPREVDGDVTVTKTVVGTAPAGSSFQVKVDCDGEHDDKTLTFGETGGTQTFERDSFGPLECDVTEPASGGASTTTYICDAGDNAECHDNGRSFTLFEDPGDGHGVHITVTNTFAVVAEPTFTG